MAWRVTMKNWFRRPVHPMPNNINISDPAQVANLAAHWGVNIATVCRAVGRVGPELEAVRSWIESRRSALPNRSNTRSHSRFEMR